MIRRIYSRFGKYIMPWEMRILGIAPSETNAVPVTNRDTQMVEAKAVVGWAVLSLFSPVLH